MQEYNRKKELLDNDWLFYKGDDLNAADIHYDDSGWQKVDLPHDWTVAEKPDRKHFVQPICVGNHLELKCDSYLPRLKGWYRKHLTLAGSDKEKQIYIEFEGVCRDSTLWVNGIKAGHHLFGYTGFYYNITPYLKFDNTENILSLKVDATKCESWWCDGSGIYRPVWLITTSNLHLDIWGHFITSPLIAGEKAGINIKAKINNNFPDDISGLLETNIRDSNNKMIVKVSKEFHAKKNSSQEIIQEAKITKPDLWSPEKPYLYKAESFIIIDGKIIDSCETRFGIRSIEFTSDKGFFLNGKSYKMKGVNIHHDFGGLGAALPDRANYKTVEVLKEMGCNTIRSAHNQASPSLMNACDELGMLFIAETKYFATDPPKVTIPPLRDLIQRDRNHPSIIAWSLANIAGMPNGEKYLTEYLKELNKVAHQEDNSRPTSIGLEGNADPIENEFAFVTDIIGYNGSGMGKDDLHHAKFPNLKMLITEYAAGCGARGIYEFMPTDYETIISYPEGSGRAAVKYHGEYASIYEQCNRHETTWQHIAEREWLGGGIMWAGIDYRGETNGWPNVISQFGVLDICRFPKDTYYYYKQEWHPEPMLHIFPHWNWEGKEAEKINVWVYSNCDEVELFLNDKSLGKKKSVKYSHIEWQVPYEPGKLSGKAYKGNKLICEKTIYTAGDPKIIKANPDRDQIKSDGRDLSFIKISIHDEKGNFHPLANNLMEINVEGNGKLIGMGSGDPRSHENPKGSIMKAFNGLLLAVVQSANTRGEIRINIKSRNLSEETIKINSI
ncbi:MAG: DUF4982 domain-containing protein [Kiritimatiellia bacterium]|nr:DUF4982 domain-containing protein [Kiritimatiellia bacterium]